LGFPIFIYPNLDNRIYTKPWEKSGRVSLVPKDIHDRKLHKLNKIRTNRDIDEPMASAVH
jgi:hypothetical protein